MLIECNALFSLKSLWSSKVARSSEELDFSLYINLEHRTDRRRQIENQLMLSQIHFSRVNASGGSLEGRKCPYSTKKCLGIVGCQLSHVRALELALAHDWPYVAIFEDDFRWSDNIDPKLIPGAIHSLMRSFQNWDVIALSLNILDKTELQPHVEFDLGNFSVRVVNIHDAKATHAYVVNRRYLPTIRDVFLSCDTPNRSIDNCWRELQKKGLWLGFSPQLGSQRSGFSDIENKQTSYNIP